MCLLAAVRTESPARKVFLKKSFLFIECISARHTMEWIENIDVLTFVQKLASYQ
jgi:hypothetical protein